MSKIYVNYYISTGSTRRKFRTENKQMSRSNRKSLDKYIDLIHTRRITSSNLVHVSKMVQEKGVAILQFGVIILLFGYI